MKEFLYIFIQMPILYYYKMFYYLLSITYATIAKIRLVYGSKLVHRGNCSFRCRIPPRHSLKAQL